MCVNDDWFIGYFQVSVCTPTMLNFTQTDAKAMQRMQHRKKPGEAPKPVIFLTPTILHKNSAIRPGSHVSQKLSTHRSTAERIGL
jgi:hypothetical protein